MLFYLDTGLPLVPFKTCSHSGKMSKKSARPCNHDKMAILEAVNEFEVGFNEPSSVLFDHK